MALYDDEPTFTLRARDPLAPILVELWVRMRRFSRPLNMEGDNKLELDRRNEQDLRFWDIYFLNRVR